METLPLARSEWLVSLKEVILTIHLSLLTLLQRSIKNEKPFIRDHEAHRSPPGNQVDLFLAVPLRMSGECPPDRQ